MTVKGQSQDSLITPHRKWMWGMHVFRESSVPYVHGTACILIWISAQEKMIARRIFSYTIFSAVDATK